MISSGPARCGAISNKLRLSCSASFTILYCHHEQKLSDNFQNKVSQIVHPKKTNQDNKIYLMHKFGVSKNVMDDYMPFPSANGCEIISCNKIN